MSTRLRVLNIALGLVGCLLAAGLGREVLTAYPLPSPPAPHAPRPVAAATAAAVSTAPPSTTAYGVIVAKNLFSASRTEAPAGPVVAAGPRPLLHGVVMDGPKSRAYLEDPLLKHTFSYGIGDTVGGGRVESIAADRVVIARGDGVADAPDEGQLEADLLQALVVGRRQDALAPDLDAAGRQQLLDQLL